LIDCELVAGRNTRASFEFCRSWGYCCETKRGRSIGELSYKIFSSVRYYWWRNV